LDSGVIGLDSDDVVAKLRHGNRVGCSKIAKPDD
jgi:hypothetical protein